MVQPDEPNFPINSSLIVWNEFLDLTGAMEAQIRELIDLGWLESATGTDQNIWFRQADLYKTRKLTRICADFEIPSLAGAIIVDLLQRITELESMVGEAEHRLP